MSTRFMESSYVYVMIEKLPLRLTPRQAKPNRAVAFARNSAIVPLAGFSSRFAVLIEDHG